MFSDYIENIKVNFVTGRTLKGIELVSASKGEVLKVIGKVDKNRRSWVTTVDLFQKEHNFVKVVQRRREGHGTHNRLEEIQFGELTKVKVPHVHELSESNSFERYEIVLNLEKNE